MARGANPRHPVAKSPEHAEYLTGAPTFHRDGTLTFYDPGAGQWVHRAKPNAEQLARLRQHSGRGINEHLDRLFSAEPTAPRSTPVASHSTFADYRTHRVHFEGEDHHGETWLGHMDLLARDADHARAMAQEMSTQRRAANMREWERVSRDQPHHDGQWRSVKFMQGGEDDGRGGGRIQDVHDRGIRAPLTEAQLRYEMGTNASAPEPGSRTLASGASYDAHSASARAKAAGTAEAHTEAAAHHTRAAKAHGDLGDLAKHTAHEREARRHTLAAQAAASKSPAPARQETAPMARRPSVPRARETSAERDRRIERMSDGSGFTGSNETASHALRQRAAASEAAFARSAAIRGPGSQQDHNDAATAHEHAATAMTAGGDHHMAERHRDAARNHRETAAEKAPSSNPRHVASAAAMRASEHARANPTAENHAAAHRAHTEALLANDGPAHASTAAMHRANAEDHRRQAQQFRDAPALEAPARRSNAELLAALPSTAAPMAPLGRNDRPSPTAAAIRTDPVRQPTAHAPPPSSFHNPTPAEAAARRQAQAHLDRDVTPAEIRTHHLKLADDAHARAQRHLASGNHNEHRNAMEDHAAHLRAAGATADTGVKSAAQGRREARAEGKAATAATARAVSGGGAAPAREAGAIPMTAQAHAIVEANERRSAAQAASKRAMELDGVARKHTAVDAAGMARAGELHTQAALAHREAREAHRAAGNPASVESHRDAEVHHTEMARTAERRSIEARAKAAPAPAPAAPPTISARATAAAQRVRALTQGAEVHGPMHAPAAPAAAPAGPKVAPLGNADDLAAHARRASSRARAAPNAALHLAAQQAHEAAHAAHTAAGNHTAAAEHLALAKRHAANHATHAARTAHPGGHVAAPAQHAQGSPHDQHMARAHSGAQHAAPHVMHQGKKGGSYYVGPNGHRVYVTKH